jgi:general stress protein 26
MNLAHKVKILDFLRTQKLATISTANPETLQPESALIAFTEDDNLCLYFQTGKHTRKAQNLKANPRVAFVFGLVHQEMFTVQYEGVVKQLTTAEELEACKQQFIAKDSPTTEYYFNHPSSIFFKVTPTWIGCSDYRGKKPDVIEIKDFNS